MHDSYLKQLKLITDFNSGKFNLTSDVVENMVSKFPNISVTTLPMNYLLGRYLIHEEKIDKALELIKDDENDNPYLYNKEELLAQIFVRKDSLKLAEKYASIAFHKLPNATVHQLTYITILLKLNKIDSIIGVKNKVIEVDRMTEMFAENYLTLLSTKYLAGDSLIKSETNFFKKLYPSNIKIQELYQKARIGNQAFVESNSIYNDGLALSEKKENYLLAINLFKQSIQLNPYFGNPFFDMGMLYYKSDSLVIAEENFKKAQKNINSITKGKIEFYLGMIYLEQGKDSIACSNFLKAYELNFSTAEKLYKTYCDY